MPKRKKSQKARSQNYNDLINIFGYVPGRIKRNDGSTHEEVELSQELLREYSSSREMWAVKYQEAIEFRAGAQWSNEEKDVLEARGQAPIVVNRIHPIVETAKSLLTYNSPQFRSTAREDSDRDTAKVFSDLFAWIWEQSTGNEELKKVIDDYYVGGMGVFNIYQDPQADMGKGEVYIKSINPLDVYIDPNAKDIYARDAAHILVAKHLTDEQAMQLYPDFMDIIQDASSHQADNEDYPTTDLAATEGQIFKGDDDNVYHTKRKFIERYTKEMHSYWNVFEPFNYEEFLMTDEEYDAYTDKYYIVVRKITGEEVIVSDPKLVEEMFKTIESYGTMFHFELPEPEIDEQGNIIPADPIKVPGMEDEDAIPGSTTVLIPTTVGELVGMGKITANEIEKCCVAMTVSVGDNLLYERVLPVEEYPIVPLMNIHHRNPFPESDVRLFRPLQEYINKIRSLIIAHASTSTNVKLLIPRGSADIRMIEEEWGRAGTSVIEFDAELGAPIVAGPVPLPNELYKNEADAKYDLEYGFGIFELMQGSTANAPSTYRGTLVVDEFGQRRIKSRRDDVENFLNQAAKVAIPLMQQLYTEEKVVRLVQPNGTEKEQRFNFYKEMDNEQVHKWHDIGTGNYDVRVVSGSTLPTNRMALLATYQEMYQAGLIDQVEVLKKSELVDVEGVLERAGQMKQMQQQMEAMAQELKQVKGDLQTATREELHAKKRLEVEKFSSGLDKVKNRAEAATTMYQTRLADVEQNLINSAREVESEQIAANPLTGELESGEQENE
tara:strand:- start:1620 stop:3956 length:2337 start_codon:yes stop_codon:yes gene_type:complete